MNIPLFFCLPLALHAQDFSFNKETGKAMPNFVAELKLMKGRILRTTGGRPQVVQVGEKFYPNDVVTTDERSTMKLLVVDDTWLAIGPSSEIQFSEFDFREKTDRKITFDLRKGRLSANVRQPVKSGRVNFRSRYTSMAVRGTKIMMNYREVNGTGVTEYALIEGKALVTDSSGKTQELLAGERLVLLNTEDAADASEQKLRLSQEEIESFTSPDADEDRAIRPFMPFYEPKIAASLPATTATGKKGVTTEAATGEGSFSNLKKLNEQLLDNQKKNR